MWHSKTVYYQRFQKVYFLKALFDVACIFNKTALSLLHENDDERFSKFFDITGNLTTAKGASMQAAS